MNNYIGHDPAKLKIRFVRVSTFEFKFFEAVDVVDPDADVLEYFPVDVRGYDYVFEIREHMFNRGTWFEDANGLMLRVETDHFSFGQTQKAIDYDISENNDPGTTYDELFITLSDQETKIDADIYDWGLRRKQHVTDVIEDLFISKLKVLQNIAEFSDA